MLLVPSLRGLARQLYLACLALTVAATAVSIRAAMASADDGYDPNVDGNVFDMALESDGKLILCGQFGSLKPNDGATVYRSNIARLNPDGTTDYFDPNADGAVRAVIVQKDQKIVIGGDFTHVDGKPHAYIARINPDGTVDDSFDPSIGTSIDPNVPPTTPEVTSLAVQTDGSIIVGGSFGSAESSGATTPVIRYNLARFDGTGMLDTSYNPNPNLIVRTLAMQGGDKLLVGGGFTQFQPTGGAVVSRSRIARLDSNGQLDMTFDPEANDAVTCIALQRDGKILIGGYFTSLQPNGAAATSEANRIARLNADGTLDTNFDISIGGVVDRIQVANDGSVLVGGGFTQVYGHGGVPAVAPNIARFLPDGTVDSSFVPGVNAPVDAFATEDDGKVILGGYFSRAQPVGLSSQIARNHMARILPNGALDTAFQLYPGGRILVSVQQKDGSIMVGGTFTNIGGATHYYLARLKPDGSVDSTFTRYLNGPVYTMAYVKSDDSVLIGGSFTTIDGTSRNRIAHIEADGSLDPNFDPNLDGRVGSIVVQSDGKILVGGSFLNAQPKGQTTETLRPYMLRLTADGQLDTAFYPNFSGSLSAIALQSDGKILVGGAFTSLQPNASGSVVSRNYIARLNPDGTPDDYDPFANNAVSSIVVQADGKAIIGGIFTALFPPHVSSAIVRSFIARINTDGTVDSAFDPEPNGLVLTLGVLADGKTILAGGLFNDLQPAGDAQPTTRVNFARLTSDGKVDTSFDLGLENMAGGRVDSINVLANGNVLIGGTFTAVQPTGASQRILRNHFVEIDADGSVDSFDPGAGGLTGAQVNAIAIQPDGKILVAGAFSDLGGATSRNLVRFHPEGSPDTSFNASLGTDGAVNAVAVRATGKIAPTPLNGFAWFNADGSLRDSFKPNVAILGQVNASVVQSDQKIILAGQFSITGGSTGNLVRFNPDGTIDTGYAPTTNALVAGVVLQSDGKLVIIGNFTSVDGTTRNYIARLNADGSLDSGFDPGANGAISAVVVQPDGKLIVGGLFTSFTPNAGTTSVPRNYIARINTDGSIDSTFNPNPNGTVSALALQTNGALLAGGSFTSVQPNTSTTATTRDFLARFNSDGSLDADFDPSPNSNVDAIAVQSDGSIVLGGSFTSFLPTVSGTTATTPTIVSYLARVASNGSPDTNFTPNPNGAVTVVAIDGSGAIAVGGEFTTIDSGGVTIARNHLARVNSDGTVDGAFNPGVAGSVLGISAMPDNSLLVGGTFTSLQPNGVVLVAGNFGSLSGATVKNLGMLNDDGSANPLFHPDPDAAVNALLPLPDGRFVVGGAFSNIGGEAHQGVARFKTDGTLDSGFAPSISGTVRALALQADGMVLVGSDKLVRVDDAGALDATFKAVAPLGEIDALEVQADGRILVAGLSATGSSEILRLNGDGSADASFAPESVPNGTRIEAIALQTDGAVIVGGAFTGIGNTGIAYLARLTPGGAVDPSFNPQPNGAVSAIALQDDGRVFIGGSFNTVGGLQRVSLARVTNTGPAAETLGVSSDGTMVTWMRSGTSGELAGVTFSVSTDDESWAELGAGTRQSGSGNWTLANATGLPSNGAFYIRARGIAPSSAGLSAGVYQSIGVCDLSSPVAGASTTVVPVVIPGFDSKEYAVIYDSATGVLRTANLATGRLLDPTKTIVVDASTSGVTAASVSMLANLSTRGFVGSDIPLISGFTVAGNSSRTVLIRAVGPGLVPFGVGDYLAKPELLVYKNGGTLIVSQSGWDAALSPDFTKTGAFPLAPGSADSALVVTLAPGTYTAQVVDADAADTSGGEVLVEIYDDGGLADAGAHLVNLSSRADVSPGGTLIGGMYIAGNSPKTVLIRGIGPALGGFGVSGALSDPRITVYDGAGNVIAANDNWGVSEDPTVPGIDYSALVAGAAAEVGAFPLAAGSKDAALVVTLPAGAYSVQITGVGGASGSGMIELYQLP